MRVDREGIQIRLSGADLFDYFCEGSEVKGCIVAGSIVKGWDS